MNFSPKTLAALCVAAAIGLAATPKAEAALLLWVDIGGTTYCAADNNAGCGAANIIPDIDGTLGSLAFANGSNIGGLIVNGSLHTSMFGPPLNALNSASLSVINNSGAAVTANVTVSQTEFVGPATQAFASGSGTWQTAVGSTIDMFWYNDPTNQQGAEGSNDRPGGLVWSFSDISTMANADSFSTASGAVPVFDPALFSMTLAFDFTLVDGGQLISRGMTELKPTVPEPATLALFGLGLTVVGAAVRRRRRP